MSHRVIHGDCTEVLRDLTRDGVLVDSVCTDPPYHLASIVARLGSPHAAPIQSGATGVYARGSAGFMGQQWDGGDVAFRPATWRRVFDVMKPGAHLVAFAATKGYHRMACAIEDAGFEIRDMVAWLYGTGFSKSHDIGDGRGTALKPAIEPITLAQKPISEGSIEANVRRWGVGAINIDLCRIGFTDADDEAESKAKNRHADFGSGPRGNTIYNSDARDRGEKGNYDPVGRLPANVCHDGGDEVLAALSAFAGSGRNPARFFYSSKATQGERIFECRECDLHQVGKPACGHDDMRTHPTVKPLSLMRWLVEMVTPPGGLVLDPFAGTGTTAAAARAAGIQSLSIEASADHVRDIGVRLGIAVDELINARVAARPMSHGEQKDMFL